MTTPDASGLREAVEALAAEHWDWKAGQTLHRRLPEVLAAHRAEADPTAGDGCPCGDSREHGPHDDPLPATPPADDASEHHPTTPVQCSCGWRETDSGAGTWIEHMGSAAATRARAEAFDSLMTDDVRRLMAQEYLADFNDYMGQDLTRHAQAMAAALRAAFVSIARGDAAPDARESSAASQRVRDAEQIITLMPPEHGPRKVVASIFTGHTLGCMCEVCAFMGEEPSAAATRARAEGAAEALRARSERDLLTKVMWDVRASFGFDTDGDHRYHTQDFGFIAESFRRDMAEALDDLQKEASAADQDGWERGSRTSVLAAMRMLREANPSPAALAEIERIESEWGARSDAAPDAGGRL